MVCPTQFATQCVAFLVVRVREVKLPEISDVSRRIPIAIFQDQFSG